MPKQKMVVLGVTGCIAAYKAAEIVRALQKAGLRVKVVMTEHACEFITPLTFEALTGFPVGIGMFEATAEDPIPHITLAREADAMLIAPATANMVAKLATGIADDLLSSTALAMEGNLIVAPAANVHMYTDPSTQANIETLNTRGVRVIEADQGYLACGDEGKGRLADIDDIVNATLEVVDVNPDLAGMQVLVTAGPTIEAIDPVRFITNHSSGKTGYALAEAARDRGANVTLVTGPTNLQDPEGITTIHINSAQEMLSACSEPFATADIAIFSAAVSDFRPESVADHKLKKGTDSDALTTIHLVENPDVLATLAAQKTTQAVIGYAAETHNVLEGAHAKLTKKQADAIVANRVGPDCGFGTDDNQIWIVTSAGEEEIPLNSKDNLANVVLDRACTIALEKKAAKK